MGKGAVATRFRPEVHAKRYVDFRVGPATLCRKMVNDANSPFFPLTKPGFLSMSC
jgi:hypothetical protein